MGNEIPFPKLKLEMTGLLRMAIQRVNLLKDKRLQQNSKQTKEIRIYLENGNEDNAKIWAETVINNENYVKAVDVVKLYLEQLLGRLDLMKDGPLPDMDQTIGTILFATPYTGVKEMGKISDYLVGMLRKQKRDVDFLKKVKNESLDYCNELVIKNIRIEKPEEGKVIHKLVDIKDKFNIPWEMSEYSKRIYMLWIDKTGGGHDLPPPPGPLPPSGPPAGGSGGSGGHYHAPVSHSPAHYQAPVPTYPSAAPSYPSMEPTHPPAPAPAPIYPSVAPAGPPESLYPRPTVKQGDPLYPGGPLNVNPSSQAYPPAPGTVIPPPPEDNPVVPPPPVDKTPSIASDLDALQERLKNLKG